MASGTKHSFLIVVDGRRLLCLDLAGVGVAGSVLRWGGGGGMGWMCWMACDGIDCDVSFSTRDSMEFNFSISFATVASN